jgi:hypothetical protein
MTPWGSSATTAGASALVAAPGRVTVAPTVFATAIVRTAKRLQKVLARHGRLLEDGTVDPSPRTEQLALSALVGAAASGLGLTGERAGKPLLRVVDPGKARVAERVGESLGVNVHAEVAVPAGDRARLERLCRYVCRPPIAQERLVEARDGRLRYVLKNRIGRSPRQWTESKEVYGVHQPAELVGTECSLSPPWPPERELPRLRLGAAASLGGVGAPAAPEVVLAERGEDGRVTTSIYSAGVGVDGRIGVQITSRFAVDVQVFAETGFLAGAIRAALLAELAPIEEFAIGLGGGVGSIYVAKLFYGVPYAGLASGLIRLEGRIDNGVVPLEKMDAVVGAEGQAGALVGGDFPVGTVMVGGRAFVGLLVH